jgi:hypothetical protein
MKSNRPRSSPILWPPDVAQELGSACQYRQHSQLLTDSAAAESALRRPVVARLWHLPTSGSSKHASSMHNLKATGVLRIRRSSVGASTTPSRRWLFPVGRAVRAPALARHRPAKGVALTGLPDLARRRVSIRCHIRVVNRARITRPPIPHPLETRPVHDRPSWCASIEPPRRPSLAWFVELHLFLLLIYRLFDPFISSVYLRFRFGHYRQRTPNEVETSPQWAFRRHKPQSIDPPRSGFDSCLFIPSLLPGR